MSERPDPYVGVSGVVAPEQQYAIETFAHQSGLKHWRRRVALGVKAVHKTQFWDDRNSYGEEWYPVGAEQFRGALSPRVEGSNTLGIAQAYFDSDFIDNPAYPDHFSRRIFQRGEPWIDGIQFDLLPWHENAAMLGFLEKLREKHLGKLVLLQCHKDAMETLEPRGVAKRLKDYAGVVDYVLFDSSHGKGEPLDTKELKKFLNASYETKALDGVGFAIAGGLNGDLIRKKLPSVVKEFPDISWDAEGQLHPPTAQGTRPLDMRLVEDYLRASAEVLATSAHINAPQ